MKRRERFGGALLCALTLAANGTGALAQGGTHVSGETEKMLVELVAQAGQSEKGRIMVTPMPGDPVQQGNVIIGGPGDVGFSFVSTEMAFDSKVVKGAPYSADAVTETVQVLGDGNRITHTTNAKLFRDSEGRTRREQTLNVIGSWSVSDDAPHSVFINDPVGGASYVLDSKSRTARKVMQYTFTRTTNGEAKMSTEGNKTFVFQTGTPAPEIRGGVLNGKALKRVQPAYPPVAQAAGAQGIVEVQVTLDEQGNVVAAKAVSGHPLLQQAAVEAARQWTFSPTKLTGNPVKVTGMITFNFALSDKEGATATSATATTTGVAVTKRESGETTTTAVGIGTGAGGVMLRERVESLEKMPKFPETQESLGRQNVEGVEAEGTRTTITIAAGAVGNERPIQIVSERWYSPELQTVVMTRHSDPRFGETTYRLTNISRAEPDHSLFEVPAGFSVIDRGEAERKQVFQMRKQQQQ